MDFTVAETLKYLRMLGITKVSMVDTRKWAAIGLEKERVGYRLHYWDNRKSPVLAYPELIGFLGRIEDAYNSIA